MKPKRHRRLITKNVIGNLIYDSSASCFLYGLSSHLAAVFCFKLWFWFAQQGAIYVFVVLIFVYARQMKSLDRKFGVGDDKGPEEESQL
jgi:putative solute:sodium symporter small subunit